MWVPPRLVPPWHTLLQFALMQLCRGCVARKVGCGDWNGESAGDAGTGGSRGPVSDAG